MTNIDAALFGPAEGYGMYGRILVPTDGSEAAVNAFEHALDLAAKYDADIYILAAVDSGAFGPEIESATVDILQENAQDAVDELAARAEKHSIADVTKDVVIGTPHQEILDYGDDHNIDLIVMSTHGRSGLERYLLGSVTERVVRSADIPVLTVRSLEDEDGEE